LAASIDLRLRTGLDVVVTEAGSEPVERFGESLPPDIVLALDRLGLGDAFRADGHCRCPGNVSLWGRDKLGYNDFILNPMGPAWHIDRRRFDVMLRTRARETGASIWTATRAVAAEAADDGFVVTLRRRSEGSRRVRAARVLDATGSAAWFARSQGAVRSIHDRLVAIVRFATIISGTFTSQTLVEATVDGWWYCARLPAARIVTVLVTDRREARAFMLDGYARWRTLLASTTLLAPYLDACRLDEQRFRTYPVTSFMLDRVEADRWFAIGDAASGLDPIVSQGIVKAFADAADATVTIGAAVGRRAPPPWRYTERVAARFGDYLANRAHFYRLERRWADSLFWQRRALV
jgi:flavin-dependent dehydrogenase